MIITRVRTALVAVGTAALLAIPATIATTSAATAATSNKLTVTAGEYTYKLSGSPKPGNVEIVFDNAGVEIHMVVVIQLKPSVTDKQLKQAMLSDDDAAVEKLVTGQGFNIGGTPGLLSGGVSTTNIASLKAGHYGLLCFVPDPEGVPHVAHGMVKVFDVKGSKSTLKPPTDGVSEVELSEAGITLPSAGLPKNGWIKVTNTGSGPRDLTLAKYEDASATFEQVDAAVDAFFETGAFPGGTAPVLLNGGVSTLAPGASGYVEVTFESGRWTAVSSDDD
ncbi:MAG: hypothetical protein ABW033_05950, partial [Acidimicrobiia bacterium]